MTINILIFFIINWFASILAGSYLFYSSFHYGQYLLKSEKAIYRLLSLIEFYYCFIYTLVILGVLFPGNYSVYIRPIASIIVISPALIVFLSRIKG